jgi:hypothetical protein
MRSHLKAALLRGFGSLPLLDYNDGASSARKFGREACVLPLDRSQRRSQIRDLHGWFLVTSPLPNPPRFKLMLPETDRDLPEFKL